VTAARPPAGWAKSRTDACSRTTGIPPSSCSALIPSAWHHVGQYADNPVEADHSQLKQRLRPMRGLPTDRTVQAAIAGHAFVQNLRRGHYERGIDASPAERITAAFNELAHAT
jgi:transposase-like protein